MRWPCDPPHDPPRCGCKPTRETPPKRRSLTAAQLDGRACLHCGTDDGAMGPIGWIGGCQVFAHAACAEGRS